MSAPLPVALALRVYPPRQGSILSASLAPRSRLEPACQHCDEASSSQGCLMSLTALLSPSISRSAAVPALKRAVLEDESPSVGTEHFLSDGTPHSSGVCESHD